MRGRTATWKADGRSSRIWPDLDVIYPNEAQKKPPSGQEVANKAVFQGKFGGAYRGRTDDLLHAMQAL